MSSQLGEEPSTVNVSALYCYPVKSCGGIALEEALVDARGFQHDRQWMIVNEAGLFLTQRDLPRMALIRPRLETGQLVLRAPAMPEIALPFKQDGTRVSVTVWRSACEAIDQGREIAEWLSTFLSARARLVRMADDCTRQVNPEFARRPSDQVGFADGYPFLLISENSLNGLNQRLLTPVPMNRFRPNIVISGCEPHAEDAWNRVRIGEVNFDVVKPCARCVITTTDQHTAERGEEPLKTLASYRKATSGGILFGQNLIHANRGTIRVGDLLTVVSAK
jgi:uncharacterized protein YcbX